MTLILSDITSGEMTFKRLDRLPLTQNKDPLFLTTRLLIPIKVDSPKIVSEPGLVLLLYPQWVIWVITIRRILNHLFPITFCQFGSFNVTKHAPVRFTLLIDPRNETKNGRSYNVTTWFRLNYSLVGKECADQEEQYFPFNFTFYSPGNE